MKHKDEQALSRHVMEGQQIPQVFLREGKTLCPLDGIPRRTAQMPLQSPARQSNHFSTCTGNVGSHVKKIRWQFLVSTGR